MQLTIKLSDQNRYPVQGILIRHESIAYWAAEIQRMQLDARQIVVYPLPGKVANSVYGCLIRLQAWPAHTDLGRHMSCQLVSGQLFIPAYSDLYPSITAEEIGHLCRHHAYLLHPEIGLVALEAQIDWTHHLQLPPVADLRITTPAPAIRRPDGINSFMINPLPEEEALSMLEQQAAPEKKEMEQPKKLNPLEQARLKTYEFLFGDKKEKDDKKGKGILGGKLGQWLGSGAAPFGNLINRMEQDFHDLEERNKREIDRLMDMFRNNLEEALKYAIPLNSGGRGADMDSLLQLTRRNTGFSLTGGSGFGSGGTIDHDRYAALRKQYHDAAELLVAEKQYEKAAYVYMNLLRDHAAAANVLERGQLYAEAAAVYVKHLRNTRKAAECYEKANMTERAIELYAELTEYEHAADLCMRINRREDAQKYYRMTADNLIAAQWYVKAANLLRDKMHQPGAAQELLLKGWQEDRDAVNCLQYYFANHTDDVLLCQELERVYREEVISQKSLPFLHVLRTVQHGNTAVAPTVRDLAYETIAAHAATTPAVVGELVHFSDDPQMMMKDVVRYQSRNKRRKA